MNIETLEKDIRSIYQEMHQVFKGAQVNSGFSCPTGCGKCCQNPEVEASVLEMIPMAMKLWREGQALEWLDFLPEAGICHILESHGPGRGRCSSYEERPIVCRAFGVSGYFDKSHAIGVSLCCELKELHSPTEKELNQLAPSLPVIADWAQQVFSLSPELSRERYPLNVALKMALEKVLFQKSWE